MVIGSVVVTLATNFGQFNRQTNNTTYDVVILCSNALEAMA